MRDDGLGDGPPVTEISGEDFRKKFWKTAKLAARHVPFMDEVVAAYFCAVDKDTPFRTKAILGAALTYFVLPVDAIPDFVLGFGFTDDLAVLTAALAAVSTHVTAEHREAAKKALSGQA